MYEDSYLVPANAKKGTLILNIFRTIDLAIFAIGVGVTLVLLLILADEGTVPLILSLVPAGISSLLVLPISNYHNVLCAIQSIFAYLMGNREYEWKGWCFYEQFNDGEKNKK